MLELLAPAGDEKSFYTAINHGADAVYLGLGDFNARMKAENFDGEKLRDLVEYAHFYGVKVYVAVNTIVQNKELKGVLRLVKVAVEAGADAFIVQDMGVAKMLSDCFPGIILHLSTQGGVNNVAGAKAAQRLGFRRVVLARETTLEDIRAIREETSLELEFFIQGALCVAYSGNCYLSALEQGASGNRGLCKQMCRLPYCACAGGKSEEAFMLSARDISLANSLEELAGAGVTSFKIEGRMRREGYVGQAVRSYRRLLDALERGERTLLAEDEEEALKISFSRGEFSRRAYLDFGAPDGVIEKRFNNHAGVKIGKVVSVKPFKAGLYEVALLSDREIKSGDGLKFFVDGKEVCSLGVGDPKNFAGKCVFVTATKVPCGAEARLTLSAELDAKIAAKKRYVPIKVGVYAMAGEPLSVTASCMAAFDDGYLGEIAVTKWQDGALEKARTAPVDEAELIAQASKSADTGFVVESCEAKTNGVFVPKSVINGVRREAFAALKEKLIRAREVKVGFDEREYARYMDMSFGPSCAIDKSVIAVTSENVGEVRLGPLDTPLLIPREYSAKEVKRMLGALGVGEEDVILQLPVIMGGRDMDVVDALLEEMPGICSLLAENISGLSYLEKGYMVVAGAGLNIANDVALSRYAELGCSAAAPSVEFKNSLTGAEDLPLFDIEGELPLMTFAHCPYKTLFENDCEKCSYTGDLTLKRERHAYTVRRTKLARCYFGLYPSPSLGKM